MTDKTAPRWIAIVQIDGTKAVLRNEDFSVRERDGQTFLVYPNGVHDPIADFVGYLQSDRDIVPFLRD